MKFLEEKKVNIQNKTEDSFKEYINNRNIRLKMTAKERANNSVSWFNFIYFVLKAELPDDCIKQQARNIEEKFFTNNPYRIWCDVIEYRELFAGNELANSSGLNIIVSTISQDKQDSEKTRIYQESRQKDLLGNYTN